MLIMMRPKPLGAINKVPIANAAAAIFLISVIYRRTQLEKLHVTSQMKRSAMLAKRPSAQVMN